MASICACPLPFDDGNKLPALLKLMIPNLLTVAYLALAIHVGISHEFHLWGGVVIAAIFLVEAVILKIVSGPEKFLGRWSLVLFVQFPLFLCISFNRYWPVLDKTRVLYCISVLAVGFFLYGLRRDITGKTLIRLIVLTLPAFIVLVQESHYGLILTSNEWRLMAEEGQIMGWITKVLHGQIPFRDAIVTRGPTIIYSTAAVFKFFGESFLIKRVWFAVFNLLMTYAGYYFCKTFISSKPLGWFVFVVMLLIHDFTYRTGFGLLALALFWVSISRHSLRFGVLSGISLALAVLSSVEVGAAASVTMVASSAACYVFRADHRRTYGKIAIAWVSGTVLIFGPLLLILAARGEVSEILTGMLIYPKYAMLGYAASPYPNLLKMIQADLALRNYLFPFTCRIFVLWYLPSLIYLFSFFLLMRWIYLRKLKDKELMIFTITLFGWLFYHSALGRTDIHHLYFCVSPAFALLAMLADRPLPNKEKRIAVTAVILIPVLFLLQRPTDHIVPVSQRILQNLRGDSRLPEGLEPFTIKRMQGILGQRSLRRRIEATVTTIQSRLKEGDCIYAFPNLPLYYFLLDSPNPTRFEWAYQAITHNMRLEVVTDLEEKKPKFVIYSLDPSQRLDRIPLEEAVPEIVDFLGQQYKPWAVFGREQILIPKGSRFRSPRPIPEPQEEPAGKNSSRRARTNENHFRIMR